MSRSRSARHGPRSPRLPLLVAAALLVVAGALFARSSRDGAGGSGDAAGVDAALRPTVENQGDAGRETELGHQLLLAGDEAGAEAAYRRAVAAAPDDATARVHLGRLLLERGHRFSARRELARAVELAPDHAEAHYFLGVAYDELGFDSIARRHYRRAFELAPALTDPKRHPEVARQRQALAALLEQWIREQEPSAATIAAATGAGESAKPDDRGEAEPSAEPAAEPSTGPGREPGYARVTGGEPTDPGAPGQAVSAPAAPNGNGGATGWQTPRKPARSRGAAVIDPSDLSSGTSVNQVVAPGDGTRGSVRSSPSRPISKPSSRGFGSRFTPPARPTPGPFAPFEPGEESTGRIEPLLVAPDDEQFAIGG